MRDVSEGSAWNRFSVWVAQSPLDMSPGVRRKGWLSVLKGLWSWLFYDVALYSWGDYSTSQGHCGVYDHTLGTIIARPTEVWVILGNSPRKHQVVLDLEQRANLLAIP